MMELYKRLSLRCSRMTTTMYSTSFSLGVYCLHKKFRDPIYAIYGFVRFADEIVDTFHDYNKQELLDRFREDTYRALEQKISLNPILHSFQYTARQYKIESTLIELFLRSMEMDLHKTTYSPDEIRDYILGSAEVIGLMCLRVFSEHNKLMFDTLAPFAQRLGCAFQKVNFLRDLNADYKIMGRMYFPGVQMSQWSSSCKQAIEKSIEEDFSEGLKGIRQLPHSSRLGVYVVYVYYLALFKKIKNTSPESVMEGRIRIASHDKARLLVYSVIKHQLNMI